MNSEGRELVVVEQRFAPLARDINWDIMSLIEIVAQRVHKFFRVTADEAMATMIKGYELGLPMTTSFAFIAVVRGVPCLIPRGHLALLHKSMLFTGDGFIKIEDNVDKTGNPESCTVSMRRNDTGFEYSVTWGKKDAEVAGLVKSDSGYKTYPANMYRWRAIGFCADVVAPDIAGGLKRADELGAQIDKYGEILEKQITIEGEIERSKQQLQELEKVTNDGRILAGEIDNNGGDGDNSGEDDAGEE